MATTEVSDVEKGASGSGPGPFVLYVDDEPGNLELFRLQFEADFEILTAESAEAALPILEKGNIAVLLSDERMPGMRGVDLLAHAAQRWPDVVRVIVSAYGDAPRLLGAINHGHAHEYILKPWDQKELRDCITRALAIATRRRSLLEAASRANHIEADEAAAFEIRRIIGKDGGLAPAIAMATRAASSPVAVLLIGEQGTGKELIARLIHAESKRADAFMRANCRAEAVAVELFGSEKGGVITRGRLESAGRGTLFLDGVAELPMPVQVKLVRALDEGVFEREGGRTTIPFQARVVGATHRSLHELTMDEKKFSPQLKYHFNVVVPIPPLRERAFDIPALASYFAEKNTRPGDAPKRIDEAALQALATYSWPGNVRELAHIVARAVALSSDDEQVLGVEDFTFRLDLPAPGSSSSPPTTPPSTEELSPREEARANETIELRRLLLQHGGNVARAARALGVPRTTLLSRAKRLGLLA